MKNVTLLVLIFVLAGCQSKPSTQPAKISTDEKPSEAENWHLIPNIHQAIYIAMIRAGNDFCRSKQYEKAISHYTNLITAYPHRKIAYYNRAAAYYSLKKYERVIEDCSKAIELDHEFSSAYWYRAKSYQKLGLREKAREGWKKTIVASKKDGIEVSFQGCIRYIIFSEADFVSPTLHP